MSIIAIIPARGGSERVERKNVLKVGGKPLIVRSVEHARAATCVDMVYVSTDDDEIAAMASDVGAAVIRRPAGIAGAKASSESALLHVLDARKAEGLADPDLVVFLQCTSPLRAPHDIDRAVETLRAAKADSLFSACEDKGLMWAEGAGGLRALNYDVAARRREQDMVRQWRENGSIYVFKPSILRGMNNRIGGKIAVYGMDVWHSFQVDAPDDLNLVELVARQTKPDAVNWPARVALVVFDFDGVMTDNAVYVDSDGRESVRCNRADGLGLDRLRAANIPSIIMSTETNPVVAARAKKLQLLCFQSLGDKGAALGRYLTEQKIDPAEVVYVGNDLNDLGCFELAGFPVAVADSHHEIKARAKLVLKARGGEGAVRELCDLLVDWVAR